MISIAFGTNEHSVEARATPDACSAPIWRSGHRYLAQASNSMRISAPTVPWLIPWGVKPNLALRLAGLGYKCWFAEDARVRHIIRPNQMRIPAILLRGYRWGRGQAHMQEAHHYPPRHAQPEKLLRWALYPLLMPFYGYDEAWARQWEWVADQGYEDGWRECQGLAPRWLQKAGAAHRIPVPSLG